MQDLNGTVWNDALGDQVGQMVYIGGAVEDVLQGDARLGRVMVESAQGCGVWVGCHLGQGDRDGTGLHLSHQTALIGGGIAADGFGGDLDEKARGGLGQFG